MTKPTLQKLIDRHQIIHDLTVKLRIKKADTPFCDAICRANKLDNESRWAMEDALNAAYPPTS